MRPVIFLFIFFYTFSFSHLLYGQFTATLQYQFYSPVSSYQTTTEEIQRNGMVSSKGAQSPVYNRSVFTMMDVFGRYDGCQPASSPMNHFNAVAIVQRGGDCTFSMKITRAKQYGAAGR